MSHSPQRTPRWLTVDPVNCTAQDLSPAVEWLAAGGIVLVPTDTFYGLAVDPRSEAAVDALFDVKGRDARMAVPLVASSLADVARSVTFDPVSARLAETFWPGPLSLILDAPADIAPQVHGGRATVAIRVPADHVLRTLAAAYGGFLTATSANRSGSPPASHVDDIDDVIGDPRVFVVDAGRTPGGAPSTIVDARSGGIVLVRDGAMPWERVIKSIHA